MTRPIFYGSLRRRVTFAAICTLPMLWVIVASVGGQTRSAPADLLITNGKVYAADGTGRFFQAVAVGGGKVLRVGSNQEVADLRGPSTNVIDARGRTVVPGFNDSHVHFLGGGLGLSQVDLAGLETLAQCRAKSVNSRPRTEPRPGSRDGGGCIRHFPAACRRARSSTRSSPIVPRR